VNGRSALADGMVVIVKGFPELRARLAHVSAIGDRASMTFLANQFAESLQRVTPVGTPATTNKQIGALRESVTIQAITNRRADISVGGPDAPYARAVEFGASPHPIRARRARRLRFFWQKKGRMFVGPMVNHPGNRAQPFFLPTVAAFNMLPYLRAEVVKRWNKAA